MEQNQYIAPNPNQLETEGFEYGNLINSAFMHIGVWRKEDIILRYRTDGLYRIKSALENIGDKIESIEQIRAMYGPTEKERIHS